VAPTEKGLAATKVIWTVADFHLQTSRTQRGTGTSLLVILKQKPPGTATSSSHLAQKMRMPRNLTDSSTFGGTEILSFVTLHTSLTEEAVVGKAWDGDWTTVR
jgi:hypothetical protein